MFKSVLYTIVFLLTTILFFSCGKETSESLLSFNQNDVENNGNPYNEGCLNCDLFTWCDNAQYTYMQFFSNITGGQFVHKYKNVGTRRVGSFDFTATVGKIGDTIFHNCQNNITRILGKDRSVIFTVVKGDGQEGDTWTDTYQNGDTVIKYKIIGIDVPVTIGTKTYVSTVIVSEDKFYNDGGTLTLVTKTENAYAIDRINAVRIGGIGLIKQEVKNPTGLSLYQRILTAYSLP